MDIAARIIELREARGYSTNKLAKLAGVGQSTLREIEQRIKHPTVATIERICTALGITLADFFAPTGDDPDLLPAELRRLLAGAKTLSPEELAAVQAIIDVLNKRQNC